MLDLVVRRGLCDPIEEVLPGEDRVRVAMQRDPVAGMGPRRKGDLERAVGFEDHVGVGEVRDARALTLRDVPGVDAEGEVRRGSSLPAYPVGAITADERGLIVRVGIVEEELAGRV